MRVAALPLVFSVLPLLSCSDSSTRVETWPPEHFSRSKSIIQGNDIRVRDAYELGAGLRHRFPLDAVPNDTLRFSILNKAGDSTSVAVRIGQGKEILEEISFERSQEWNDYRTLLSSPKNPDEPFWVEFHSASPFYVSHLETFRASPDESPPNVLLIMIDTLLRDHTSLFGYHRDTTPHLVEFAEEATVFEDAISVSSFTRPSIASMFSGYYPDNHGATDHGSGYRQALPALSEALRKKGYATVGFSANGNISPDNGFDRGFERFIYQYYRGEVDQVIADSAIDVLEHVSGRPWFAYVHFVGPHNPLVPMSDVWNRYQDPENVVGREELVEILERTRSDGPNYSLKRLLGYEPMHICEDLSCPNMTDLIDRSVLKELILALYDAEIFNTDRQMKRVLDAVRAQGDYDNTLIIIVSDHGEEFWHHGGTHHAHTLFDELTRTILLVKPPNDQPVARRVGGIPQEVDLLPTIVDYLDIPLDWTPQGQSLRLSVDHGANVARNIAQSNLAWVIHPPENFFTPGFDFVGGKTGPVFLRSARDRFRKVIYDEVSSQYLFFDLQNDPSELNPIYEYSPEFEDLVRTIDEAPRSYRPGLNIMFCAPLDEPSVFSGTIRVSESTMPIFDSRNADARLEPTGDGWSFEIRIEPSANELPFSSHFNPILSLPLSSNAEATLDVQLNGEPYPLDSIRFWRMISGEWAKAAAQPLLMWGYAGPRQAQLATTVRERPSIYTWFWDPGTQEDVELSPEMIEQMKTLGYL